MVTVDGAHNPFWRERETEIQTECESEREFVFYSRKVCLSEKESYSIKKSVWKKMPGIGI